MTRSSRGADFFDPMRFEAEVLDCEVEGRLPAALEGTFYRSCADRRFAPLYADDTPYNSDGAVDCFRFYDGHVDFRSRYVRTQRFLAERAAHRALFGRYRNRSTSDPSVRHLSHTTANTTPIVHAGMLFSLKEERPPTRLDPDSLDDARRLGLRRQAGSDVVHRAPEADPRTGELIAFSYEAQGRLQRRLAVHVIDAAGAITNQIWFKVAGRLDDARHGHHRPARHPADHRYGHFTGTPAKWRTALGLRSLGAGARGHRAARWHREGRALVPRHTRPGHAGPHHQCLERRQQGHPRSAGGGGEFPSLFPARRWPAERSRRATCRRCAAGRSISTPTATPGRRRSCSAA